MSSSLLLQQFLACLVRLTRMVCYFVGCCFQDLFKTARRILVYFPFSFFSLRFVSVRVGHPYCSIDTVTSQKKSRFILPEKSDFQMINNLSIADYTFAKRRLKSYSVDVILLLRYMNLSTYLCTM